MRVGWHSTTLESAADGSVLIVPNSDVSTVPVRNMSAHGVEAHRARDAIAGRHGGTVQCEGV